MFKAIVENCDRNVTCTKNQFYNIGKFSFPEVLIACEENGIKFDGEKSGSAKVLENLQYSESKFIKKISGDFTKEDGSLYQIDWLNIDNTVKITFMENIIEQTDTFGPFHTRLLRILKVKGYLNE